MIDAFKPLPGRTQNLAATSSAAQITLSQSDVNTSSTVRIFNAGANPIFMRPSNSGAPGGAQAAGTTADMPIAGGASVVVMRDPLTDTYSFVYAATQTGTVYLTPGTGGI
jgi:hypothetical protein